MSDMSINDFTLAIITTDKNMTSSGGCPIFYYIIYILFTHIC